MVNAVSPNLPNYLPSVAAYQTQNVPPAQVSNWVSSLNQIATAGSLPQPVSNNNSNALSSNFLPLKPSTALGLQAPQLAGSYGPSSSNMGAKTQKDLSKESMGKLKENAGAFATKQQMVKAGNNINTSMQNAASSRPSQYIDLLHAFGNIAGTKEQKASFTTTVSGASKLADGIHSLATGRPGGLIGGLQGIIMGGAELLAGSGGLVKSLKNVFSKEKTSAFAPEPPDLSSLLDKTTAADAYLHNMEVDNFGFDFGSLGDFSKLIPNDVAIQEIASTLSPEELAYNFSFFGD